MGSSGFDTTGARRCAGSRKDVQLPHADDVAENRRHPLHVNVHLGQAGTRQGQAVVFVQGTAADLAHCDGYVND